MRSEYSPGPSASFPTSGRRLNTLPTSTPAESRQAARAVAQRSADVTECARLLDMLGLLEVPE